MTAPADLRTLLRCSRSAAWAAALVLACGPVHAVTYTYTLTGRIADMITETRVATYGIDTTSRLPLTNVATGTNDVGAIDVAVGDVIKTTLTLDGAVVVPTSDLYALIYIILLTGPPHGISFDQSVTFFRQGTQVVPFQGVAQFPTFSTNMGLAFGGVSNGATLPFSFDRIEVSAVVSQLMPASPTLSLAAGHPELLMSSVVPEPAALALMAGGLVGVACQVRRRKRAARRAIP